MKDFKVPKYRCIDEDGKTLFEYVFLDDIPEEYEAEFTDWINGQTTPMIEDGGRMAFYAYDYERWVRWKTGKTNILIFD